MGSLYSWTSLFFHSTFSCVSSPTNMLHSFLTFIHFCLLHPPISNPLNHSSPLPFIQSHTHSRSLSHILSLTWFLFTHSLINILTWPLPGAFSHPPTYTFSFLALIEGYDVEAWECSRYIMGCICVCELYNLHCC